MTYAAAIRFLYGLQMFGTQFGLEQTRRLAALAGNPQARLRFIHLAGTNGKGSTAAMLESIYRAAGLRVGLFTSPHLVHFGERIQVNRQMISEADIARLVAEIEPLLKEFPAEAHPTFFEVVTVMALCHFAAQNCDLVIWETGLGGRLDATNIVTPLASVITNIQFDHERWLGNSLASIAAEKAGIIKPGVPAVTGAQAPEALAVIREAARRGESFLTEVKPEHAEQTPLDRIELPLLGRHQRLNAALAVATVDILQRVLPVNSAAIEDGLKRVEWAGRMQLVKGVGGRKVLLDGAHNPDGAETLRSALAEYFPGERPALILGVLADKNRQVMCEMLTPVAREVLCVPVSSERTAAPDVLAGYCRRACPAAPVRACASLEEALRVAERDPFVVVAGSLYLIGEAMEKLHLVPVMSDNERALNEWGAASGRRA